MGDDVDKIIKEVSERAVAVAQVLEAAGIPLDGTTTAALMTLVVGISQGSGMRFEKFVGTAADLWESARKAPAAVERAP